MGSMNMITVVVKYDPANTPPLTIEKSPVPIGDQDWVLWDFQGLAQLDLSPRIVFTDAQPLGPFASVRVQPAPPLGGDYGVYGKGNSGTAGNFTYRALLLDPQGNQVAAASGTIINSASNPDSSPVITVQYMPPQRAGELGILTPNISKLNLNPGDTVAWVFLNPPARSHAVLSFQMPDCPSLLGPFDSTGLSPFADGFIVTAMNYQPPSKVNYLLQYTIELWLDDDKLAGIDDPSIENLGPPPPPTGTGTE